MPDSHPPSTEVEAPSLIVERLDTPGHALMVKLDAHEASSRAKTLKALVIIVTVMVAVIALLPGTAQTLLGAFQSQPFAKVGTPILPATPFPIPLRLITTRWQAMTLPPGSPAGGWNVALSPNDATVLLACGVFGSQAADGSPQSGPVALRVSADAGATWQPMPSPSVTGVSCRAAPTPGSALGAVVSVSGSGESLKSCLTANFFVTLDAGHAWSHLAHTALAPATAGVARCDVFAAGANVFFHLDYGPDATVTHSALWRSVDGGAHWARADVGLAETAPYAARWGGGSALLAEVRSDPAGEEVWMSPDLGTHWSRTSQTLIGQNSLQAVGPDANPATPVCACAVSVTSGPSVTSRSLFLADAQWQWRLVPPLPSTGASAINTGLMQLVGLSTNGDPLVIGIKPFPYPVTADAGLRGQTNDTSPRLWEWDVASQRWKKSESLVPCLTTADCPIVGLGTTVGVGADGVTRGVWAWLARSDAGRLAQLYRIFVPGA